MREARGLIDAAGKPLKRSPPGRPDSTEDWPMLTPKKSSNSLTPKGDKTLNGDTDLNIAHAEHSPSVANLNNPFRRHLVSNTSLTMNTTSRSSPQDLRSANTVTTPSPMNAVNSGWVITDDDMGNPYNLVRTCKLSV